MKKVRSILANAVLIFFIVVCILPFAYMFIMSFKSTYNAYDFSFDISSFSFVQYEKIFNNPEFMRYFYNSIVVALAGVALTLFTSCTAGYAFARFKFKGSDKIFFIITLTLMVPSKAILVPLYLVARGLGILNTYWALILPLPTAFGVFLIRQAILGVPSELIESAKIDGASNFIILRSIILPLIKSQILVLMIVTFIGAWNNFLWPLIAATKSEMLTLPVALTTMKTEYQTDIGLTMACAMITFLPPFIFYLLMQSKFHEGISLGGLRG